MGHGGGWRWRDEASPWQREQEQQFLQFPIWSGLLLLGEKEGTGVPEAGRRQERALRWSAVCAQGMKLRVGGG
jgi:hypothetical protein